MHSRIVPSTHTGPPQLSHGLMPHATNTRRNASKLSTNAITPITVPAAMPGHMLTLDPCAVFSSSCMMMIPFRPYAGPGARAYGRP